MGTLTPGATYIYERVAGTIFAREFGKTERKVVGYATEISPDIEMYRSEIIPEASDLAVKHLHLIGYV